MKFLRELMERVRAVNLKTNKVEPDGPVERGEKAVGVLPDDLKKDFIVLSAYSEELESCCAEVHPLIERLKKGIIEGALKPKDIDLKDLAFIDKHVVTHNKYRIMCEAFWISVREHFTKDVGRLNVGLRQGWQVVTWNERVELSKQLDELSDSLHSDN